MELNQLKEKLLQSCREFYRKAIETEYAPHTQINIIAGVEEGLEEFRSFVIGKRAEFAELVAAIDGLQETSIADDFQTASDEDMKSYVAGAMPSLTTDDQKLSVAIALQS